MKHNILLFTLILLVGKSLAATSIITPTVAGHWTTSGSPYMVYNNITIDATAALTIDPGVTVLFAGPYSLTVNGVLHASGTTSLPVTFTVSDTTGWWNGAVAAGGWQGIQFMPFSGTGTDSSLLQYCDIWFTKIDSASVAVNPNLTTLYVQRGLSVSNCNLINNKSGYDYMMYVVTAPGQSFSMSGCTISGNTFSQSMIFIDNFFGGNTQISGNTVYGNESGNVIFSFAAVNLGLDHNDIYNNTSANGTLSFVGTSSTMVTKDCHATVNNNKIHHNTNIYDAAIVCYGGFIDINANLVCNNQHTSGSCGYIDGGGGINLAWNTSGPFDSTYYVVRDNVIANNYSPFHGGGINVMDARSLIVNNQVVNNRSAAGGALYIFSNFAATVKNNIFYGNITNPDSTSLLSPDLEGSTTSTVEFDHNWTEHNTAFNLNIGTGYTLAGDTTTNVTGADPKMVSPTLTADVTESALAADFSLQSVSPCINAGDSTGADMYNTDYAGHNRFIGPAMDIGAFEFNPGTLASPGIAARAAEYTLTPNPAMTTVNLSAPCRIGIMRLADASGRILMVQRSEENQMTIDISHLAPGIYFVTMEGGNTSKLVKL